MRPERVVAGSSGSSGSSSSSSGGRPVVTPQSSSGGGGGGGVVVDHYRPINDGAVISISDHSPVYAALHLQLETKMSREENTGEEEEEGRSVSCYYY